MTPVLATVIAVAIGLPHLMRLQNAPPMLAATIWVANLVTRALAAAFVVVFMIFFLPGTELFALVTQWCWHAVLPLFATHLGFSGHELGDAATLAPAFLLAVSLLSVISALWRATRAVARLVRGSALAGGPAGSLIVSGPDVFVAAAGLAKPQVVVSAGALTTLDDEELAASLEHERGHIARRHRYLLVMAELCRALGRFIPGTKSAATALLFHLERDADEYAVARRHDPLALASAICKAAGVRSVAPALMALGGGEGLLGARIALLTGREPLATRVRSRRPVRMVAIALAAFTIALAAALPFVALAGAEQLASASAVGYCPD